MEPNGLMGTREILGAGDAVYHIGRKAKNDLAY
jgi:hypothetical protein